METAPFGPTALQQAVHAYTTWNIYVPTPISKDDLMDPRLYVHVARFLKFGDEIRVMDEAQSFCARLIVTYSQGTVVKVIVENYTRLEKVDMDSIEQDQLYTIALRGPNGWCVIETKTGEVIKKKCENQAHAQREADDLNKAIQAA